MTTANDKALTPIKDSAIALAGDMRWGMTREQLDLLKRTVAEGTTDDEFALFMTTAQRLELDPFAKQIYAVKRSSWSKEHSRYVDKMAIQVGIDGFRGVADRTGLNDGQEGPFWCGDDGVWRDIWLHDAPPAAARVVVFKKGSSHPFTGVASYRSYVQTTKDGKANRQWEQMPDVMLAKCAEALALRKAFPAKLSGVYAPEEMGQADNPPRGGSSASVIDVPAKADESALEAAALELIAEIREQRTPDAVRALGPKCAALPKGSRARASVSEVYNKRIAETTAPEAA